MTDWSKITFIVVSLALFSIVLSHGNHNLSSSEYKENSDDGKSYRCIHEREQKTVKKTISKQNYERVILNERSVVVNYTTSSYAPIRIFFDLSRISTSPSADPSSTCYAVVSTIVSYPTNRSQNNVVNAKDPDTGATILYNCTSNDLLSTAKVNFIKDTLIPYTKAKLESALSVISVVGK